MGSDDQNLLGREARGQNGSRVGRVIRNDETALQVELPDAGAVRVPHGDVLRLEAGEVVLRHGHDWYAPLAGAPRGVPASLQDGRLHDVSVDGEAPIEELQPSIDQGDAPLRPSTATDRGLRASSFGSAGPAPAPEFPVLDIAAQGLAIENSDRIEPGEPGTHRGGVMHAPPPATGDTMSTSSKHYLVGLLARGSDGQTVGRIIECNPESFTIEKGHLVPRDQFVPYDQIVRVEEGVAILRETGAYYRSGGDMQDGEWTDEVARRSRAIAHDRRGGDEVGLSEERTTELAPEEEDERAPTRGEAEPGVHVVSGPERFRPRD